MEDLDDESLSAQKDERGLTRTETRGTGAGREETEVTRTETRGTGRDLKKRRVVDKMDERERLRVTQDEDSRNKRRLGGILEIRRRRILVPPLY